MDYLEIRELYHHGIKGQKWGIRRFQNEDGSLTAEGKKRYQVNQYDGSMSKEGKKLYKQDLKQYKQELKLDKLSKSEKNNLAKAAVSGAGQGACLGMLAGTIGLMSVGADDFLSALGVAILLPTFAAGGAAAGGLLGAVGNVSVKAIKNKKIDEAKAITSNTKQTVSDDEIFKQYRKETR
ncbi:MAG: hypothetical protein IKR19_00570 [Acholeplasmatales bacterium]|nr:hypothetical protein [Acholeplasmatales bacterium]